MNEKEIKNRLKENSASPEAVQGMWQAYSGIKAAKIRGRYLLLASGVVSMGIFGYQAYFSKEAKKINDEKAELEAEKIRH